MDDLEAQIRDALNPVPMPINTARQAELWALLKDAHPDVEPRVLLDIMAEVLTYLTVGTVAA